MTAFRPDRRKFLKLGVGVVGASLVLGINWSCTEPSDNPTPETDAFSPNAWLRIDEDGSVTVMVAESEMGQGPYSLRKAIKRLYMLYFDPTTNIWGGSN